jgi:hypothetical protein
MIDRQKTIQLYQSILDGNDERVFKHWHASSIAMCPRNQFYKRKGIKGLNKPSAAKVIRWSAGHHLETAIRDHVANVWGATISNERLTSKEWDLTGEFDNKTVSDNRLIEIKSVHDMAFIERSGEASLKERIGYKTLANGKEQAVYEPKTEPYLAHQLQNHAYVILLAEQGIEVKNIDYVYLALGGRLCVYTTEVSPEYLDNVKQRLMMLKKAQKTNTPPPCMCHMKEHPLYESTLVFCDYKNQETDECCSLSLLKEVTNV